MKEIQLTKGYVTQISDADYAKVAQYKWHAYVGKSGLVYATGRPFPPRKPGRPATGETRAPKPPKVLLHRFLLGVSDPDVQVDHRDRDTLNNQRRNLRRATHQQNRCNQVKRAGTSSVFKGVSWNKADAVWQSKIESKGVHRYVGGFASELEAALAYDRAAFSYHGPFASLNFPSNKQHLKGWLHMKDRK